jgi:alpha-amylase/alpha-mannosidase (GH57 family)
MDPEWRIIGIVNNYSKISFNFGPTLLYWIEAHESAVYDAILSADKESLKSHPGHGNAIAQVYNHMIMPLANKRDKETQVKWGITDFKMRFGRDPEGMWLPETAVDIETLETLAENNIKFTVLAPHQALRIKKTGDKEWVEVQDGKIDPRRPYVCRLPSGKTINLFFFDQFKASLTSFGDLLSNGELFANKLMESFKDEPEKKAELASIASDGEVYGHHHPHGDMSLAYCLYILESKNLAKITNYGEFLEKFPPEYEVEIKENTSWSCVHGIERWRSDCGDNTGREGWRQGWRKPLREAMDRLRDEIAPKFEAEASKYLKDPWGARNDYIDVVLDRAKENVDRFILEHAKRELNFDEKKQVIKLLEIQRQAMLMFTSCGWYFDEISGIETVQVMMYAARAMQLSREALGLDYEDRYLQILKQAPTNISEFENGAKVYDLFVKTAVVDLPRIGARNAMLQLFKNEKTETDSKTDQFESCLTITHKKIEKQESGKFRLTISKSIIQSAITLDEIELACAAVWLGDHNIFCGIRVNTDDALFENLKTEVSESFKKGQMNETLLLISKKFDTHSYSLKDMFKDDQMQIIDLVIKDAMKKATELNEIVYHDNSALLRFLKEARIPQPKPFRAATEIAINAKIKQLLSDEEPDVETLSQLISEAKDLSIPLDQEMIGYEASERVAKEFRKLKETGSEVAMLEKTQKLLAVLAQLPFKLNLWTAQNAAFELIQGRYRTIKDSQKTDDQKWVQAFRGLCESIGLRLD